MHKYGLTYVFILLAIIVAAFLMCNRYENPSSRKGSEKATEAQVQKNKPTTYASKNIAALTSEAVVVPYVKQNRKLPNYYITKKEAREKGWNPAEGNLCKVLPERAIGGDVFSNREKLLPAEGGRKWFEADLNYNCGNRNADRLLYSNDGLVYVTYDHYKTFKQR